MSTGKEYIVQERPNGEWAVIAVGGERASAIEKTEAKGIATAKELNPENKPHIRRVRGEKHGQFRK